MKNLIFVFSLLVSVVSFAQDFEQNIIDIYGQSYYDNLVQNNSGVLNYLENFSNKGLELVDYNEKFANADLLLEIPLRSKSINPISIQQFLTEYNGANFNPLKYGFNSQKEVQVYRLTGDSRVLIVYSLKQIED